MKDTDFLQVWEQIDQDKVLGAVRAEPLFGFDLEEVARAIYGASLRWLLFDLEALAPTAFEETRLDEPRKFKYICDMEGRFTGEGVHEVQLGRSYSKAKMAPYRGLKFVLDWKTTKSDLDERWRSQWLLSWQWKHYLAATAADVMIYRGVQRTRASEDVECGEFFIHRDYYPDLSARSARQIGSLIQVRNALIEEGVSPWPQAFKQSSCFAFSRECPYKAECHFGNEPQTPFGALTKDMHMSYSGMEEFGLCPERYRRSRIDRFADEEESSGPDAGFGKAFHRGIAEVYRQAFGLPTQS